MPTPAARPLPALVAPSRHVYDVIVLGSQLGGVLAAALLARRGYSVLLIEHDGTGAGYEHDGFVLPYAPFIAPALKAMPVAEEAFNELGLTTQIQRNLRPHMPELQLVLPRHRVDLHADAQRRRAELTREWGDAADALLSGLTACASWHEGSDAFFKEGPQLPPDGFFESWGLKRRARHHPGLQAPVPLSGEDAPSTLLRGLLPFLVHLENPSSPLARARPLSQTLQSPARFLGGREGLRAQLEARLLELGGDVLNRGRSDSYVVEELLFEGRAFTGVKLVRSETVYRASCLLAATDAGVLRRFVTDRKRHRRLSEHLDESTLKSFLFTVNWVVPESALPRGLGGLTLLDTGEPELNPLLLQIHPARTPSGREDESLRVVCAGTFVPATTLDLGEEHLKGLAQRIDSHLDTLMPFTREKRVLRSAPYLDAGPVRAGRFTPHPHFAFESEPVLGVAGLRQRTPSRNVLLAGREVLPGLGFEGELLAGLRATRLAQEMLKKKPVLRR